MKKYIKIAVLSLVTLFPTISMAQGDLRSAYFLEGYMYRHKMNPAFASERGYLSLPFFGGFNIGLQSNMGLSDFVYKLPNSEKLGLFMHPEVSASEFLGNIKDDNNLRFDFNMNILSLGFHGFGGFNTFEVSMRSNNYINVPGEFFRFAKCGMDPNHPTYNFKNLGFVSNTFAEIAIGHSHKVTDKLNIGAKFKFLVGFMNAQLDIKDMQITMAQDKWEIAGNGEVTTSSLIDIPTKTKVKDDGRTVEEFDFDNIDFNEDQITGNYGFAFDLGATYQLLDDLQLSFALIDLGYINYKNSTKGVMGVDKWTFDGFQDIPYDSETAAEGTSIEDQMEQLGDDLEDCFQFESAGKTNIKQSLGVTMNIGAEYCMPFYDKLSVGFLSSSRFQGSYSWSEGRFSANIAPLKFFDASVNYAISSFGSTLGWVLNIHPVGFNLYLGSNHMFTKVNPQFIPLKNATADFFMGISFPFGKRKTL